MATRIERRLAASLLAGRPLPAEEMFHAGLSSLLGVRSRCQPMFMQLVSKRNSVVRCKLKRGASVTIWLVPRVTHRKRRETTIDPDTGLTRVEYRAVERIRHPIIELHLRGGKSEHFESVNFAATALARRSGGDVAVVTRVCQAIERARLRCFELAEQASRWQ